MSRVCLRRLTTIAEFRRIAALEHEIWGYTASEDAVPVPIFVVSAKIGGLLIGAFDDDGTMVGFVYSLPGVRNGRPFQWSHMLGVVPAARSRGVGWDLKLEQRRLTLAMGLDLIAWTFDPLQALNAHLNFAKLGVVVREYHEDVYGESSSPLHKGTATDRFVAEWHLASPRVEARLRGLQQDTGERFGDRLDAAAVNRVDSSGGRVAPAGGDLSLCAPRLAVTIPTGFTEMQQNDPGLACAWRSATREIFEHYLGRGYSVVEFLLDRSARRGTYLLETMGDGR